MSSDVAHSLCSTPVLDSMGVFIRSIIRLTRFVLLVIFSRCDNLFRVTNKVARKKRFITMTCLENSPTKSDPLRDVFLIRIINEIEMDRASSLVDCTKGYRDRAARKRESENADNSQGLEYLLMGASADRGSHVRIEKSISSLINGGNDSSTVRNKIVGNSIGSWLRYKRDFDSESNVSTRSNVQTTKTNITMRKNMLFWQLVSIKRTRKLTACPETKSR